MGRAAKKLNRAEHSAYSTAVRVRGSKRSDGLNDFEKSAQGHFPMLPSPSGIMSDIGSLAYNAGEKVGQCRKDIAKGSRCSRQGKSVKNEPSENASNVSEHCRAKDENLLERGGKRDVLILSSKDGGDKNV